MDNLDPDLFICRLLFTLDQVVLGVYGALCLCTYIYTMYPDIPGGDSGKYIDSQL